MATSKKLPAWYRARARRQGLRVGGQLVWQPADVIALIDRVHARVQALAMAIATTPTLPTDPLGTEWRDAWAGWYRAWLDFREEGRDVWSSAWGSTASTAQAFDQELDAYREAYAELTGEEAPSPLSSTTAEQGRPTQVPSFFSGAAAGATAALVGGGLLLLALSRAR